MSSEREAAKAARELALAEGSKHFVGAPCARGHSGLRYAGCGVCVECARAHYSRRELPCGPEYADVYRAALAAGETYFMGKPCRRGHSGLRYVSSGGCPECKLLRRPITDPPEKQRESKLKSAYNITSADYDTMAAAQNWRCATCGRPPNGQANRLHIDHCHDTGAVRALLCHSCNTSLGHLNDDPATVLSLFNYLIEHGKPDPRCRVQSRYHHREKHASPARKDHSSQEAT